MNFSIECSDMDLMKSSLERYFADDRLLLIAYKSAVAWLHSRDIPYVKVTLNAAPSRQVCGTNFEGNTLAMHVKPRSLSYQSEFLRFMAEANKDSNLTVVNHAGVIYAESINGQIASQFMLYPPGVVPNNFADYIASIMGKEWR